eukprot:8196861-Alexandrium_andersonii.AAC.1
MRRKPQGRGRRALAHPKQAASIPASRNGGIQVRRRDIAAPNHTTGRSLRSKPTHATGRSLRSTKPARP